LDSLSLVYRIKINVKIITITLVTVILLAYFNVDRYVFAVEYFDKSEAAFNKPYEYWTGKYWNWWFSVSPEQVFNKEKILSTDCLANTKGPVVFLMDPTFAYDTIVKNCKISSSQGILFTFLTSECDTELKGMENASYTNLANCAKEDNAASVFEKQGFIDGEKIKDENIEEVLSEKFKLTIKENSIYHPDALTGIWDAVAHGYYVFVKPLTVGNHTIHYKTFTSGVPWAFSSDIKYNLLVE
jgi:hypothetical protein